MSANNTAFALRLLALDAHSAARLLLKCGVDADGQYVDLHGALSSFDECKTVVKAVPREPSGSSFANVACISLPDNAPGITGKMPRVSNVYQFAMHPTRAVELNAQLRRDAVDLSHGGDAGQVISNVGGFHSACEALRPERPTSWGGPLAALLVEAMHTLHPDGMVGGVSIEALHLAGWLNVSAPTHFNRPHDHGNVAYSAVYFVDDGGPPGQPLPSGWSCGAAPSSGKPYYYHSEEQLSQWEPPHPPLPSTDGEGSALLPRCAGELLLQTQLRAWSSQFAVLSVHPTPGTLYLFPGYMPHAVLPRTLQSFEETTHEPAHDEATRQPTRNPPSLRISVAVNISVPEAGNWDLPTVWLASRGT